MLLLTQHRKGAHPESEYRPCLQLDLDLEVDRDGPDKDFMAETRKQPGYSLVVQAFKKARHQHAVGYEKNFTSVHTAKKKQRQVASK